MGRPLSGSARLRASLVLVACAALPAAPLVADHGHETIGDVRFPNSCRPEVRPAFERGVALLHSFGYAVAETAFRQVAADDPACAMAWWGVAMTQNHPLWSAPAADELATGRRAAEKAAALARGPGVTDRERRWIDAVGSFYADAKTVPHRVRAEHYRDAMSSVSAADPDDDEATIFHALAILGAAPASDPTHAEQRRAAGLLAPLVTKLPGHPGVAHYMIHAFDSPGLAAEALDAARRYARIAPSSPHALHMPSHIFVRLGLWPEAIASNLDSAAAARAMGGGYGAPGAKDELHALDYLAYAYLQTGQDAAAEAVHARAVTLAEASREPTFQAAYGLAAIPARLALERDRWSEAAALPRRITKGGSVDAFVAASYAYVPAIVDFARALGAARSGDPAAADEALARLADEQKRLAADPPAGPYDWAGYVESQRLAAAGWTAHARGRDDEALDALRRATALEERVGKHPVTPGSVLPARELLADLLFELDRPREALAEYEASLTTAPNRLRALRRAAAAADRAGESERARTLRNLAAALTGAAPPAASAAGGG